MTSVHVWKNSDCCKSVLMFCRIISNPVDCLLAPSASMLLRCAVHNLTVSHMFLFLRSGITTSEAHGSKLYYTPASLDITFSRVETTLGGALVFTALHGRQTWSGDENSVCLSSVCLTNAWIVTKRKKNLLRFFIPYERSFSLVFWEEEWLVEGNPFYLKFAVNRLPLERNRWFSTDIRL